MTYLSSELHIIALLEADLVLSKQIVIFVYSAGACYVIARVKTGRQGRQV